MNVNISDRKEIVNSIRDISIYVENLFGEKCINDITNTVSDDALQNLIYFKNSENTKLESEIRKIITRSAIISESKSSGSGIISLCIATYLLKSIRSTLSNRDRIDLLSKKRNEIIKESKAIQRKFKKVLLGDIKDIVSQFNISKSLESDILEILNNFSPGSSINVEKSNIFESFFKEISGHYLKIDIDQLSRCRIKKWNRSNTRSILVDGTIESISQIHHLLEKISFEKFPFIIFCRSASDEVKKTIDHNFLRGTLDALIIETNFNIKFHHLFNDLSAIFDCDIVSTAMGDTISRRLEDRIFNIDSVEITDSSILLKNKKDKNLQNIKSYIEDLNNMKISIEEDDLGAEKYSEIKQSIDNRIKMMSSSRYEIFIGKNDIFYNPFTISKIDKFFRSFKDLSETGIINLKKIDKRSPMIEYIYNNTSFNIFTQRQILTGFIFGFRIFETLIKAEKVLTAEY